MSLCVLDACGSCGDTPGGVAQWVGQVSAALGGQCVIQSVSKGLGDMQDAWASPMLLVRSATACLRSDRASYPRRQTARVTKHAGA